MKAPSKIWQDGKDDLDRVIEQTQEKYSQIDGTVRVFRAVCTVCGVDFLGIDRYGVDKEPRCPFCNGLAKCAMGK